ncbi:MAG: hypothetical protein MJ158_00370 [Alphaproteobacteria bacterium]|nr:hypothetical protein [Alphaproteobacteria bacterium]
MKKTKKTKNYLKYIIFSIVCLSLAICCFVYNTTSTKTEPQAVYETKFGNYLASQHALYVNDFVSATKFINELKDIDYMPVKNVKVLSEFLSGQMPTEISFLKNDKSISGRLIYDADLIHKSKWEEVFNRHKKDDSALTAPVRIFSGIKVKYYKDTEKFIKSLHINDSWRAFIRGQIAVLRNDIDTAAKEFAKVHPEFMNLNDYLYLMSFYKEHNMTEDMDILKQDFIAKPSGMYVANYENIPDWSNYEGFEKNLAFSVLQTVSHTKLMLYTDFSVMLLRFAQLVAPTIDMNAINYYIGLYLYQNHGDYTKVFNQIDKEHPFYLFGQIKSIGTDIKKLKKIVHKAPLFIDAEKILVEHYIKTGQKRHALRVINKALSNKNITEFGMVYFLKQCAHVYLMFNKTSAAYKDINKMEQLNVFDNDLLLLQARLLLQQNNQLEKAYELVMDVVKQDISNVFAWDVLGQVVYKTEGVFPALDLIERVGNISVTTSSLFEHLGDFYKEINEPEKATKAYKHAIYLSDDGLVVVPHIKQKLRKIK